MSLQKVLVLACLCFVVFAQQPSVDSSQTVKNATEAVVNDKIDETKKVVNDIINSVQGLLPTSPQCKIGFSACKLQCLGERITDAAETAQQTVDAVDAISDGQKNEAGDKAAAAAGLQGPDSDFCKCMQRQLKECLQSKCQKDQCAEEMTNEDTTKVCNLADQCLDYAEDTDSKSSGALTQSTAFGVLIACFGIVMAHLF